MSVSGVECTTGLNIRALCTLLLIHDSPKFSEEECTSDRFFTRRVHTINPMVRKPVLERAGLPYLEGIRFAERSKGEIKARKLVWACPKTLGKPARFAFKNQSTKLTIVLFFGGAA
jgi:hypothetical protein